MAEVDPNGGIWGLVCESAPAMSVVSGRVGTTSREAGAGGVVWYARGCFCDTGAASASGGEQWEHRTGARWAAAATG